MTSDQRAKFPGAMAWIKAYTMRGAKRAPAFEYAEFRKDLAQKAAFGALPWFRFKLTLPPDRRAP